MTAYQPTNLQLTTLNPIVGASLLAKAVHQQQQYRLTHHIRSQTHSHI
jgi:hypothetical protein